MFDRYYSQMKEMGWENITAAEKDLLSISLWEFKDLDNNNWRGLFNWTKIAKDSDKYLVYFEVIDRSWSDQSFTSAIQPIPLNERRISRELAERILENVLNHKQQKGQLLVGQLPSQLPLKLPLPNNTEIIGSLNTEDYLRILLEVPQSPEIIEQFYQQQLTAVSWKKHEYNLDIFLKSSFIYSGYQPWKSSFFCNKKQGWELSLNTHFSRSNHTDLRIQIKKSTPNSLCLFSLDQESKNDYKVIFKQISAFILTAPEKAEVLFLSPFGVEMKASDDRDNNAVSLISYNSGATIQTKLSIKELTNHYFAQMPQYDWTQVSEIKQSSIAVGLWRLQNKQGNNFQATIELIKNQDFPQQYSANLRIIPTEDME